LRIRSRVLAAIRWLWVTLSIVVLVYGQAIYDGKPNSDAEQVLAILMLMLSFPAGIAVATLVSGIGLLLHLSISVSRTEMFVVWLVLAVAGYLQWFCLVPYVWSKGKAFIARKRAHSEGPDLKRSGLA
jgi:hypothetical protein